MVQRIKVHTWRESPLIVFIDKICGIEEDVDNGSFILFDGQRQLIKESVDEVLKLIDKATGNMTMDGTTCLRTRTIYR